MDFHLKTILEAQNELSVNVETGLTSKKVALNRQKYGVNKLQKSKKRSIFVKIGDALKEPMLIILLFGFCLAIGTNIGKYFKTGQADFIECFGILFAVVLSVSISLIMEGSSEKAFQALNKLYDNAVVKVIRDGKILYIPQSDIVVGDIVYLESGDKIVADGRLVYSEGLITNESALTGESMPQEKDARKTFSSPVPLAERSNCVYSGTFVTAGNGKMLVFSVGNDTEIGSIAKELSKTEKEQSPLDDKLAVLGKGVTIIGAVCAVLVFIISVIRLYGLGTLNFSGLQDLFISCIVLIVAAVPEGLPTIVAVSLALNMIKLAKENVLIKKMVATETAGAISVICSDKTGTLTQNKMSVDEVCSSSYCAKEGQNLSNFLAMNFVLNSTAEVKKEKNSFIDKGSATECALIRAYSAIKENKDYLKLRSEFPVSYRAPFSSSVKFMVTVVKTKDGYVNFIKGAPEVVVEKCALTLLQKRKILSEIKSRQAKGKRVLCFAHFDCDKIDDKKEYIYDGFVSLSDPIRKEVYGAIKSCFSAGIKVKILTGDNSLTAYAIAKEIGVADSQNQVINASELENLSEEKLIELLPKIRVIARSTPTTKLRVVKALKKMGEVVAVTGDGINDAPAIKFADVGFSMGIAGSDITKEASDVVLLDDSFLSVTKAVAFGRNVYTNLQRFILFQLSVNISALLFIMITALMGGNPPFNTLELLWINVIMDGPPALTLGLEKAGNSIMNAKPIKRDEKILNGKMLTKILLTAIFTSAILLLQYFTNFLGVDESEKSATIFTLFIFMQLFNAFNSRKLRAESIFSGFTKNKVMLLTFTLVLILHVIIVQVGYGIFSISPMSFASWIKTFFISSIVVAFWEIVKLIYRISRKSKSQYK